MQFRLSRKALSLPSPIVLAHRPSPGHLLLLRAVIAVAACIVIFFLEERGQSDKNSHCLVRMLERRDEGLGSHRRRNVGERGVTREEDKITRSIGHEGHTPTRHGKDG